MAHKLTHITVMLLVTSLQIATIRKLILFSTGNSPIRLMVLDMMIINVFKAESNRRTINRTIYTSFKQITNAHKLMPFIFTPLWTHVYHSIYYFRYGFREFLYYSPKLVSTDKVLGEIGISGKVFCWMRCSQKPKISKIQ